MTFRGGIPDGHINRTVVRARDKNPLTFVPVRDQAREKGSPIHRLSVTSATTGRSLLDFGSRVRGQ